MHIEAMNGMSVYMNLCYCMVLIPYDMLKVEVEFEGVKRHILTDFTQLHLNKLYFLCIRVPN